MAQKPARAPKTTSNSPVEAAAAVVEERVMTQAPSAFDEEETDEGEDEGDFEEAPGQRDHLHEPLTLHLSRALLRKLRDNSREEGVTMEELASELVAEGVVLRAWEIVERKATMRGGAGQGNQGNNPNFNRGNGGGPGNHANHGNNAHSNQSSPQKHFAPANKMAQKKLQRQARQHANAMDLMQDKAAFIEYVRNQEKKRR